MAEGGEFAEASPTLVEAILRCGLAVHLSRQRRRRTGASPSNPYARLGNAVHRVLAWAATEGPNGLDPSQIESAARQRWREEVQVEEELAVRFTAESFFGPAERWPAFASTEERLVIEVERLVDEVRASPETERWVERPLSLPAPPLRGSPDLIVLDSAGARVVDYKSGRVELEDAGPIGRYGRQVLLYAAMVRELGLPVVAGEVRPIGRPMLRVEVNDATMDAACEVAEGAVRTFNEAITDGKASRLARPGDDACTFCPHVLGCPALWNKEGLTALDGLQVLEGTVLRVQQATVGSVAVELDASTGTSTGTLTIAGLDPRRVPAIDQIGPGDEIRVSGIHLRSRGSGPPAARPGVWVQMERTAGLGSSAA